MTTLQYERADHLLGIDIGGTFTDLVLMSPGGQVRTRKVLSTSDDYSRGIAIGVAELFDDPGIAPGHVRSVVHATTIATNAILDARGATIGLVTTRGFRDVLEMRRLRIPQMYNLQYSPPRPLVPRRLRLEVDERMGPRGEIWTALDGDSVRQAAEKLAAAGVEAVAIALINAYANPEHEQRIGEILAAYLGRGVHITLSSDILPEIREYERTSTAVVNAYIAPVVERYLEQIDARLRGLGVEAPLRIMQSNGGVMSARAAAAKPAYIIESGPAAGVIAAVTTARRSGKTQVISLDMGGTTAKAALIENGKPAKTTEFEVGAGINLSSKLVKGGGHAVKLPYIDISEIGAGGGSIVAVDPLGRLKVGPRSAGSKPGPACYGLGGTEPTFTDAVLVLGYLNPVGIAGGSVPLRPERARSAFEHIAGPLGASVTEVAWGAYAIAASSMTRAVKAVSTYRGRDPREFVLMAFGGNGPIVAAEIARTLHMPHILVPPACGVFSAFGLLCAETEYLATRTVFRSLAELDPDEIGAMLNDLEAQTRTSLERDGVPVEEMMISPHAELRYTGQAYELSVPIGPASPSFASLCAAFDAEHARTYGHSSPGAPTDLVSLKVAGRAPASWDTSTLPEWTMGDDIAGSIRKAYFGPRFGWRPTHVTARPHLAGRPQQGPLIIEDYDTTCVVPPDASARLDADGNIDILFAEAS